MTYKYLPHTADIQIYSEDEKLDKAFCDAAIALTKIFSKEKIKNKIKKNIIIKGIDNKNLLYNFLEEILILFDSENFILSKISRVKIKNNEIIATLYGDNAENYKIISTVKAITYSEMRIEKENNKWVIIVTLDI